MPQGVRRARGRSRWPRSSTWPAPSCGAPNARASSRSPRTRSPSATSIGSPTCCGPSPVGRRAHRSPSRTARPRRLTPTPSRSSARRPRPTSHPRPRSTALPEEPHVRSHLPSRSPRSCPPARPRSPSPRSRTGLTKVPGVRKAALDRAGFTGAVGATLVLNDGESTRVVVGLGPFGDRRSGAAAQGRGRRSSGPRARHRKVAFEYPDGLDADRADGVRAVTEGLILGAYRFDTYKPKAAEQPRTDCATIAVGDARASGAGRCRGEGVRPPRRCCFARDLVNEPGGTLTPTVFADRCRRACDRGRAHRRGLRRRGDRRGASSAASSR